MGSVFNLAPELDQGFVPDVDDRVVRQRNLGIGAQERPVIGPHRIDDAWKEQSTGSMAA